MAPSIYSVSSLGDDAIDQGYPTHTNGVEESHMSSRSSNDPKYQPATSQRLLEGDETSWKQPRLQEKERGSVAYQQSTSKHASILHDWWLWEIAATLLSLGATVAIVVILAVYDGHPLPSWPYRIQLNSLLSILSTVAKTSMLFATMECIGQSKWLLFRQGQHDLLDFYNIDEASRGPWSALQLLYRLRGRAIVASAGAFVVVASLAVDPFIQQVLSYPSRLSPTLDFGVPGLPLVTNWTTNGTARAFEASADPKFLTPLPMRAAILNSLLGGGTANSTLSLNCPTGNCTFEPAETLGFCSRCSDVTEEVTANCTTAFRHDHGMDLGDTQGGTNCTYYLPDNINITAENTIIPYYTDSAAATSDKFRRTTNMSVVALKRFEALLSDASFRSDPWGNSEVENISTSIFQHTPAPLLGFGRILFTDGDDPAPETGVNGSVKSNAIATECSLCWCVQTLETAVRNGTLTQNIVHAYSNSSGLNTADVFIQPEPNKPTFYAGVMSNLPLAAFLEATFTANMSGETFPGMSLTEDEQFDLSIWSSDAAQALWNTTDLAGLMANLADRMTDALRNDHADAASKSQVYAEKIYVSVRWPWLILPVALVAFSCVILLSAIISSNRHRTMLWKNSSLAPLFHGLNLDGTESENLIYKKEMAVAAKGIRVRLEEDADNGLRFMNQGDQLTKSASGRGI